mgnify:CR=1 FL=1
MLAVARLEAALAVGLDDVALAAALRSPAYYIAALGSRKNHAGRLERLVHLGAERQRQSLQRLSERLPLGVGRQLAASRQQQQSSAFRA